MSEIGDFLRARYAERRAIAAAATPGLWRAEAYVYGLPEDGWGDPTHWEIKAGEVDVVAHQPHEGGGIYEKTDALHIEANQPEAVIVDLDAKLAIVDEHPAATGWDGVNVDGTVCRTCGEISSDGELTGGPYPCRTLRLLAQPFAGHPDHKGEEWAP
ncbi:DUF6221 family protein [Streptomyces prasinopilosus]|uniref:DUF6221 family protein n=1 Tax=Streptomyces prasinopilosus TaxID=67344 RepID=UPI0006EB387B|nr:DUF6221 family protein [Streptomyces prasinopilosus]